MKRIAGAWAALCGAAAVGMLSGCATGSDWIPSSGPTKRQFEASQPAAGVSGIRIIDVTDAVARRVSGSQQQASFAEAFPSMAMAGNRIGPGDVVEVSIWEAPPASLFGVAGIETKLGPATTRVTTFPDQMVNSDGVINIPFAGQVPAAGRSPSEVEMEIARRLKGKANQPQVLLRMVRNNTSNVTVVGEVTNSVRMPLTDRHERLLDALAAAGGVRQPVNKMTLQITRGNQVQAMPLETIIRDPRQNIFLQPGDVVTSLFQPLSFTVLGATGKNEEVNFEATGLTLAQALARAGGLQDARADAQGVFLFRFESPEALDPQKGTAVTTPDGRVPVIYRVDLKNPSTFFVAQNFPVKNKDVLYVANAPAAELQKFLNIIGSVLYPAAAVKAISP